MSPTQIVITLTDGLVQSVYSSDPDVCVTIVEHNLDSACCAEPSVFAIEVAGSQQYVFVEEVPVRGFDELAGTSTDHAIQAAGVPV